ncbi:MAG: ketol-acid reductoisomerase [Myxococcota bacterium]
MEIKTDADLSTDFIRDRTVAIIGYGNQGHAHALNLRDSGVTVLVGARAGGVSRERAVQAGFQVADAAEVANDADVVMLLVPDEEMPEVFSRIEPTLRPGHALAFGHGFAIRFGTVQPPKHVDVIMAAPVGPGHLLRSRFVAGGGIPVVIAVHQNVTQRAWPLARSYAAALGGGRAGVLETTFREECETDLFGEQAVIVGGVRALMEAGFETLVDAGYPEELAYFECVHQMKLLVDLVHAHGIAGMRERISRTAAFGELTRGDRVIDGHVRHRMKQILDDIRSGRFADNWTAEHDAGQPELRRSVEAKRRSRLERVGARLRALMAGSRP